jgi:hypothetical protein
LLVVRMVLLNHMMVRVGWMKVVVGFGSDVRAIKIEYDG